ncbi:MAG TPA: 3-hydroxyacyl-CoA dehydrogenase/enoyl-CoA hydratase family protein [Spirochaetota bacterium]|nr:3-hydroxyacyl-CoA dehydrogenase/enoyl-CoA hydratase family protein [Spirochaetota bacterium]HOT20194.1 3-hydroxyacyl-CoA dehydrogenase/enoyl-CoA hydratase family protein [Spirochaetota bacterium]HPD05064.1 3-hydroxyacyl-CoA dehydrogenase/enoyl-CoA hydratase family protein [Spirochaetota bacterium]HQG43008.1 3-hydroxyacyl-CoA dehydrogenase/enoyl-CoA hydratase family protein [Spirochaetota bacterium]HRR61585.1 3-hydroxyacyl-CoA dehydrogenase/enoyl-CoA hydratase family protein [Spirochaetota ba
MVRRIEKAAVIGSGIMGGGIAALLADTGVNTLLFDIVPFNLTDEEKKDPKARYRIVQAGFDGLMKAKPAAFMDKSNASRISLCNLEDDFDKLKECDLIIEVVVENLKIKQDLFQKLDKIRKPTAIVTSNTSGLPLKEMSKNCSDAFKEHFMGTHFFNPVRYMHLLELIPGEKTKKEVLEFIADFGEKRLGKGIVWAKDTPNFIGNRIGVHEIMTAMKLLESENITIDEADAIMGPAMGRPKTAIFKLSDMVGLDTIHHLAENSYQLLEKDERREVYKVTPWFNKMVENKWLGDKTKQGFYKKEKTPDGKRLSLVLDPVKMEYREAQKPEFESVSAAKKLPTAAEKIKAIVWGKDKAAQFAWKLTAYDAIYAANRIPEIADSIVEIDNAMTWGYNLELGPFQAWDAIGVKESVERMEKEGMKVPENVKKMLASGATSFYKVENGKEYYYDLVNGGYKEVKKSEAAISIFNLKGAGKEVKKTNSISLIDLGDGVFCFEFHSKMNAINGEIVDFMLANIDYVKENGVGAVIGNQAGGMPGAFSAGGDLAYMGSLAKAKKWSEIDKFIANVHTSQLAAKYAPIPVVAAPYGMTLGGGCEVCLNADRIVAHAELYMGLVEIGAGLLPGGLGMMNLWRKYLKSVPKAAKITDLAGLFLPCFMAVAQAQVTMSAFEAQKKGFLGAKDRIVFNRDLLIGEAKKEVLRMVDEGYAPPKKEKFAVLGREAQGMVDAEMLNMRIGMYITPHMEFIAKKIAWVMSGGDVPSGMEIDEAHWLKLEREAFVELWQTENTQKMAEHILQTGKPLFI